MKSPQKSFSLVCTCIKDHKWHEIQFHSILVLHPHMSEGVVFHKDLFGAFREAIWRQLLWVSVKGIWLSQIWTSLHNWSRSRLVVMTSPDWTSCPIGVFTKLLSWKALFKYSALWELRELRLCYGSFGKMDYQWKIQHFVIELPCILSREMIKVGCLWREMTE